MKKVVMLFSAVVLFAGLTFAQTPQEKDKAPKPAEKTECVKKDAKDAKGGCDKKTKEACMHHKDGKGCCAKAKEGTKPATTPEKK